MTAVHEGLPPLVDLDTWLDQETDDNTHTELVAGFVTVPPSESWNNLRAGVLLGRVVEDHTQGTFVAAGHLDVVLSEVPATVRCPDVVVAPRGALSGAGRAHPQDVALVGEVVSPGSVETDWITKRAEYARAGIPAYLVVDRHLGRLALFTEPTGGAYTRSTGGDAVTLELGGHRIPVTLADLTDT